jgi:hypothetical protein
LIKRGKNDPVYRQDAKQRTETVKANGLLDAGQASAHHDLNTSHSQSSPPTSMCGAAAGQMILPSYSLPLNSASSPVPG